MSEQIRSLPGNTSWSEDTVAPVDELALVGAAMDDEGDALDEPEALDAAAVAPVDDADPLARALPAALPLGLVFDEPHAATATTATSDRAASDRNGRMEVTSAGWGGNVTGTQSA
jgi:hypothetical protein